MTWQLIFAAVMFSGCALSLDPSLDGKRCDEQGACVSGYVCSPLGICERPVKPTLPWDASAADAHVASDAAITDAHVTTSAATTVATPGVAGRVATAPDSSVADAAQGDASDAGAPDATKSKPTTLVDAGVGRPPTTTIPPTMIMPITPPTASRGAHAPPMPGAPPPPIMGGAPGTMMACPVEATKCREVCVDLKTDVDHCGACEHACSKHELCSSGSCKKAPP